VAFAYPDFSGCDETVHQLPVAAPGWKVDVSGPGANNVARLASWLATVFASAGVVKPSGSALVSCVERTLHDEEIDREVLVAMTTEDFTEVFGLGSTLTWSSPGRLGALCAAKAVSRYLRCPNAHRAACSCCTSSSCRVSVRAR
jgi:hypothetical protein